MKNVLSKRLAQVAEFVPKDAILLDIGSDHAYLPIALLQQKKIKKAIAGEVVQGPYQSALSNVEEAGLSDKITVRLADGLDAFNPEDKINTITICGMGGRLIADILERRKNELKHIECLILQPNNREDELRQWLENNHFTIISEKVIVEHQKYYEIIVVKHGQERLSNDECRFGPKLLKEKSTVFKEKWYHECKKLEKILSNIPSDKSEERFLIESQINKIKEILVDES